MKEEINWEELKKKVEEDKPEEEKVRPGEFKKTKGNYIFPSILAKVMSKVSQRTQYEASMMALVFMLSSILLMAFLAVFFSNYSTFIKVMAAINGIAAFVFLSSHLVTTYQQYRNYLTVMNVIEE